MKSYLEFERDVKVLEEELKKLKDPFNKEGITEVDTKRISEIQSEIDVKLKASYANLNEWQRTQVARHEERPKAKFFIENLFTNFINLSGDRRFAEDEAVLAGFFRSLAVFRSGCAGPRCRVLPSPATGWHDGGIPVHRGSPPPPPGLVLQEPPGLLGARGGISVHRLL